MTNDGKSWFTDGTENILLNAGDEIPDGFHKGRVIGKKKSQGVCYNNGIENRYIKRGDLIPEGFVKGMKPRSKEVNERSNKQREETNLKKYGVKNPSQSEVIKQKKIDTCKEHYGVDNPSQADEVKKQKIITSQENWSTDHPMQSQEVLDRMRSTNLEKRGVDFVWQSEEAKEKSRQTSIERYGTEYPTQSKVVQEKSIKTSLERYNVEHPAQCKEIKERMRDTFLEKYNVDNPMKSEEVRAKARKTLKENIGYEYALQSPQGKRNFRKTSIERYGTDNPSKSDVIKGKIKDAWKSGDAKEKYIESCMEKYGVPYPFMLSNYKKDSSVNQEFSDILSNMGIDHIKEFPLGRYSYDFKVGKVLVEIDPMPFHNALWSPFNKDKGVDPDYHQKKSQTAFDNGYSCIHIFDWDDKDKVIELLKKREKVYARDTKVFGLESKECNEYLKEYHLQGTCLGQSIRLALRDSYGEIVSVMTFGKPRYNKNYQWELLRLCSHKYVIGGAEKLFKYFIENYNPESIISYCDRAKFSGKVYKSLGFKLLSTSKPSKHWYSPDKSERMQHITDNFLRQRGYDQIFGASFGKGTSNEELIINRGYVLIYDCGQDTYIWKR